MKKERRECEKQREGKEERNSMNERERGRNGY
jgi:hypothetical protein